MIVVNCKQYDDKWWDVRRGVPTASEWSSILTPAKLKMGTGAITYAHKLIAEEYDLNYGDVDEYVSAGMKNGILMEPEVRKFYEFARECDVEQVGFILTDDKRFGCSPDGMVSLLSRGLELKHPAPHTHIKWLLDNKLPDEHKAQCHGGMIVTGYDTWDFLSHIAGFPPLLITVERDDYTEKLTVALDEFWDMLQTMRATIARIRDPIKNAPRREFVSPF